MKVQANLKLLTIDLDDTLWPCMPVIIQAEKVLFDWLTEHAPRLAADHSVDSLRNHRKSVTDDNPHIAHNLTLTRQISLQQLLQDYDYDTNLAYRAIELFRQERNKVTPFDDVIPVLRRLGGHFLLVAVTNGNVEIEKTPLKGYFRYTLTAESVGASKPDPAMFNRAMHLTGTSPAQTIHIGDDPQTDIAAAHDLGIKSIWVNRYNRKWPEGLAPAHREMTSLVDLPELLIAR